MVPMVEFNILTIDLQIEDNLFIKTRCLVPRVLYIMMYVCVCVCVYVYCRIVLIINEGSTAEHLIKDPSSERRTQ